MAYSKLHSSIVNSSLWTERDDVRLLFITMLAMCDKDGCVYGSRLGIERAANILIDKDDRDPWKILMSPDPDSSDRMRAPENEGRRIEEIPGGFRLLNFGYYRGLRNDDDRRQQNREAQKRFKERNKPDSSTVSRDKPQSATVSRDKPISETETETEAEAESLSTKTKREAASPPVLPDIPFADLFPPSLRTKEVIAAWAEFVAYRAERQKKVTKTAAERLLKKLEKMGPETAVTALGESVANSWTGVFAPKSNQHEPASAPYTTLQGPTRIWS